MPGRRVLDDLESFFAYGLADSPRINNRGRRRSGSMVLAWPPGPGDFYHGFGVHQVLPGFQQLCIVVSGAAGHVLGTSCVI